MTSAIVSYKYKEILRQKQYNKEKVADADKITKQIQTRFHQYYHKSKMIWHTSDSQRGTLVWFRNTALQPIKLRTEFPA